MLVVASEAVFNTGVYKQIHTHACIFPYVFHHTLVILSSLFLACYLLFHFLFYFQYLFEKMNDLLKQGMQTDVTSLFVSVIRQQVWYLLICIKMN